MRLAFRRARPYEHVVVDAFLDAKLAEGLDREFPAPSRMKSSAYGSASRRFVRDIATLGPSFRALDRLLRGKPFLDRVSRLAGEPLIRDPNGRCGGLFLDAHGMELEPHLDVNATVPGYRRRLTLLLYLNRDWRPEWGGALELYADPASRVRKAILPVFNRAVLMASHERSWHGYSRIVLPPSRRKAGRRVLIVNFYGKKGMARAAGPHYNIWMPHPLPASVASGAVLSRGDAARVRGLLARRDELVGELRALEASVGRTRSYAPTPAPRLRAGARLDRDAVAALDRAFKTRDAELRRLYALEWGYRRLSA